MISFSLLNLGRMYFDQFPIISLIMRISQISKLLLSTNPNTAQVQNSAHLGFPCWRPKPIIMLRLWSSTYPSCQGIKGTRYEYVVNYNVEIDTALNSLDYINMWNTISPPLDAWFANTMHCAHSFLTYWWIQHTMHFVLKVSRPWK